MWWPGSHWASLSQPLTETLHLLGLNWTLGLTLIQHFCHEWLSVVSGFSGGKFNFKVMHVSPQTMLFCMQCHGPSSVHAELRRTADIMESVRCVSSLTSSDRGLDGLGRRGGGFSAPAVIQLCYAAAPSSSSADRQLGVTVTLERFKARRAVGCPVYLQVHLELDTN